jgi:hypothetical protein
MRMPSVTTGLYSPSAKRHTICPLPASAANERRAAGSDSYAEQEPQLEK